jgi:drug/metabolite transporter (DMT)-like permease
MSEMILGYASAYAAIVIAGVAQVLLKIGTEKVKAHPDRRFYLYYNPASLTGYSLMVISLGLNLYALQHIPLKSMVFILPTIYIVVPLLSRAILKEQLTPRQVLAYFTLILGTIVFNLPGETLF